MERLCEWLEKPEVNEYLNEDENVTEQLNQMLDRDPLNLYTTRLNRDGAFYMVEHPDEGIVGYLRLVPKPKETSEIVVTIGETDYWGRGLGSAAIREGLKKAFFDMRLEQVKAKIHPENKRSLSVFIKQGFNTIGRAKSDEIVMEVTQDEYLEQII